MVLQRTAEKNVLVIFLRLRGILKAAPVGVAIVDDWDMMLQRIQSRLIPI